MGALLRTHKKKEKVNLTIGNKLNTKRGGTINDDDPAFLTTLKNASLWRYNLPHQCCRPNPLGDPRVNLEISLQLTSKRAGTINDDDPTLLTTQKLVGPPPVLKKKIGNLHRYNSPHQRCRPNPIGDPKVKLEINLQLTSKRGSTINDDDPTLLTTQRLVLLQSLRKKLEIW